MQKANFADELARVYVLSKEDRYQDEQYKVPFEVDKSGVDNQ